MRHVGQFGIHWMLLCDITDDHALVELRVPRADADRANEMLNLRMLDHHHGQAAQQQHQGKHLTLVFDGDKRTSQLNGLLQCGSERLFKAEQGAYIEAFDTLVLHNLITQSEAIGSCHLLFLLVPKNQMLVMAVELIGVETLSGAFADEAESLLAKPAQLVHQIGDLVVVGQETLISRSREQQPFFAYGIEFLYQQLTVPGLFHRSPILIDHGGLFLLHVGFERIGAAAEIG